MIVITNNSFCPTFVAGPGPFHAELQPVPRALLPVGAPLAGELPSPGPAQGLEGVWTIRHPLEEGGGGELRFPKRGRFQSGVKVIVGGTFSFPSRKSGSTKANGTIWAFPWHEFWTQRITEKGKIKGKNIITLAPNREVN